MSFQAMTLPTGETVTLYKDYLGSEYWTLLKELYSKLNPIPRSCDCCGNRNLDDYYELHHLRYDNLGKLTDELFDLIKVCKACHQEISTQEKLGLNGIEAVNVARAARFDLMKILLNIGIQLHHEGKRVGIMKIEEKKSVVEFVNTLKQKGIIDNKFSFNILTSKPAKNKNKNI